MTPPTTAKACACSTRRWSPPDVSPVVVGDVYCSVISGCLEVALTPQTDGVIRIGDALTVE